MPNPLIRQRRLSLLFTGLLMVRLGQAQTAEVVSMEKLRVKDVLISKQILPTARPFSSVFGTDDNIVDVPRNVTIISRQQLSGIRIASVLEFSKLTSSSCTTTNFGAPANPSIRGQTADLFSCTRAPDSVAGQPKFIALGVCRT